MVLSRRQFLGLIGALGLSSCKHANVPLIGGGSKGPFTVAAMNDLHLLDARSAAFVNHAVEQINATPDVRFTVVIGDLTSNAKLSEFNLAKASLDRLKMPYFAVPGNHDVQGGAANPFANYLKDFNERNWVHDEGGWSFIGLDSCEGTSSDVTIGTEQMEWLKKHVRKIGPNRPMGLFAHHPFNSKTKYRVKNAEDVLALFADHKLKFVACGHWHGNQVEEQNGILFTTTACCSSTRTNFDDTSAKGYRLFHLDGDKVTTDFVEVSP